MPTLRALQLLLRVSVVYDLVSALLLLWTPSWLLDLFQHPAPADPFLFRLASLPLLLLPMVYWSAAADPMGRPEMVRMSFRLRFAGAASIAALVLWQQPPAPQAYWFFALGDLVWALLILLAALPAGLRLFGD